MWEVMHDFVIMHDKIIESEHTSPTFDDNSYDLQGPLCVVVMMCLRILLIFLHTAEMRGEDAHEQMQNDFAEHL
jgi:hypothetical protein